MNRDQIVQALMFFAPLAKWDWDDMPNPENATYKNLIWKDSFYAKPTEEQLQSLFDQSVATYASDIDYRVARREAYPTIEEQLDIIFHDGVDVWKEKIQQIKDSIPKTGGTV
jgi:hypothetical protein